MMAIDTTDPRCGGPAFPSGDGEYSGGPNHLYGMSLRDYFAGKALSMFTADAGYVKRIAKGSEDFALDVEVMIARNSYALADAMLAERGRK